MNSPQDSTFQMSRTEVCNLYQIITTKSQEGRVKIQDLAHTPESLSLEQHSISMSKVPPSLGQSESKPAYITFTLTLCVC